MGLYLYCIGPEGHRPGAGLRGLEEEPVHPLEAGGLTVWASSLEAPPSPSPGRIRRHDRVIRTATAGAVTPLPLRFGQWFATRREAVESVDKRKSDHLRALEDVRGSVEFGVRILGPGRATGEAPSGRETTDDPEAAGAGAGRAYLEALARRQADEEKRRERGRALARELGERLVPPVRRQRPEAGSGDVLAAVSQLVARTDVPRYRGGMRAHRKSRPELRFVVSGPWPPYSFVT